MITSLALFISACGNSASTVSPAEITNANTKRDCNVEKDGVEKVLLVAKRYNPTAKKKQIEFMRFHVTTSGYISAIEKALSKGSKTVELVGKNKKIQKMEIKKATWRACTFAIRALQTDASSNSSYKLAVPGDGFKY
jgi:hypothetical protein